MVTHSRECLECGELLSADRPDDAKFCNEKCKLRYHYCRHDPNPFNCTAETGTASELIASIELMKRGYEVFRAICPAASCDLIALKSGATLRIQVKTAVRSRSGRVTYPKPKPKNSRNHDRMAIVLIHENSVQFIPPLD